jgi:hypothetical protein
MLNEVKHLYLDEKSPKREEGFFAPLRMTFREVLIMDFDMFSPIPKGCH